MLMSAAIFEVFCTMEQKGRLHLSPRAIRFLKTVSGASFGVYLIHIYWCDILIHPFQINITGYG